MKRVKKIIQCQNHIVRALSGGSCTSNTLEHKACDNMTSITFDEYIHALKDLAFNGRIIRTACGFKLAVQPFNFLLENKIMKFRALYYNQAVLVKKEHHIKPFTKKHVKQQILANPDITEVLAFRQFSFDDKDKPIGMAEKCVLHARHIFGKVIFLQ